MEKQVIYGVFAMDVKRLTNTKNGVQELHNIAEVMKSMSKDVQKRGRFVRAYKKLEDAVTECYDANGWLIDRRLEVPDGVSTGVGVLTFYFPRVIEVNE